MGPQSLTLAAGPLQDKLRNKVDKSTCLLFSDTTQPNKFVRSAPRVELATTQTFGLLRLTPIPCARRGALTR